MIITFKSKPKGHYIIRDGKAVSVFGVKVPEIKRIHCDMNAFRTSKKFGSYANSDLFLAMLKRFLRENNVPKIIEIDNLPDFVTVKSGFMAVVEMDLSKL